jgi:hypothetical protein
MVSTKIQRKIIYASVQCTNSSAGWHYNNRFLFVMNKYPGMKKKKIKNLTFLTSKATQHYFQTNLQHPSFTSISVGIKTVLRK